jgi:hypothetical protein
MQGAFAANADTNASAHASAHVGTNQPAKSTLHGCTQQNGQVGGAASMCPAVACMCSHVYCMHMHVFMSIYV